MKKRIVSMMMAALLALSLAACGGKGSAKPAEETPAEETQEEQEEQQTEEAAEEEEEPTDAETPEAETEEAAEASEEEDSIEKLVADIISLEQGTAGSQLKAVGLAARFLRLYASGQADIMDVQTVTEGLSPEDREMFENNFVDIIWPYIQDALNSDEMVTGILGDLGISDEIDQIVHESLTEDDIRVFTEFAEALRED